MDASVYRYAAGVGSSVHGIPTRVGLFNGTAVSGANNDPVLCVSICSSTDLAISISFFLERCASRRAYALLDPSPGYDPGRCYRAVFHVSHRDTKGQRFPSWAGPLDHGWLHGVFADKYPVPHNPTRLISYTLLRPHFCAFL